MMRTWKLVAVAMGVSLVWPLPSYAQLTGQQSAAAIINNLAPDVSVKVRTLGVLLDREIKEGKLTEKEVQRGLLSGGLGEKLRTLDPDAGHLPDDLKEAMKNGSGPGEDSLLSLLGGLGLSRLNERGTVIGYGRPDQAAGASDAGTDGFGREGSTPLRAKGRSSNA